MMIIISKSFIFTEQHTKIKSGSLKSMPMRNLQDGGRQNRECASTQKSVWLYAECNRVVSLNTLCSMWCNVVGSQNNRTDFT